MKDNLAFEPQPGASSNRYWLARTLAVVAPMPCGLILIECRPDHQAQQVTKVDHLSDEGLGGRGAQHQAFSFAKDIGPPIGRFLLLFALVDDNYLGRRPR